MSGQRNGRPMRRPALQRAVAEVDVLRRGQKSDAVERLERACYRALGAPIGSPELEPLVEDVLRCCDAVGQAALDAEQREALDKIRSDSRLVLGLLAVAEERRQTPRTG